MNVEAEDLVEFGRRVTLPFNGREVAARADRASGYVFFDPPPPEELEAYYLHTYQKASTVYYTVETDYEADKNRYHADRILEGVRHFAGRMPQNSVELGCAYGGLVHDMAGRGIAARGFDINAGAVAEGRSVKGNMALEAADNVTALGRLTAPVDLIYSLHVLEHDPKLVQVLRLARQALSADGLLFVAVPNAMYAGSVLRGFKANPWVNYPQHLHMLSPGVIPALCEATGFVPLAWSTGLVFETDDSLARMLSPEGLAHGAPERLALMMSQSGFGMELNMLLAPQRSRIATRHAAEVGVQLAALEAQRRREVAIRGWLCDSAGPPAV
ncbi:class I SAM-dependent methyltransferase [Roseomonas frigidaquae]|uniref:Class I SAM-dependent methyltransferase n=1 Tax=Falsiroseomonas frigidaquae TaxID=487318 RepID=A0ABX1F414_9PROT|nr:methyltransferase domain-containing protein [Falsiroseomonas frigidaquae]NKE47102.1 class I SAM-dependent methyltransferase [Falsiroseomonas frigidaquae]